MEGGPGGRLEAEEDEITRRRRASMAKSNRRGAEKVFGQKGWRRRRERGKRTNFRIHVIFIFQLCCSELYLVHTGHKKLCW